MTFRIVRNHVWYLFWRSPAFQSLNVACFEFGQISPSFSLFLCQVRKMATKCRCSDHVSRLREGTYMVFGKAVIIRVGNHFNIYVWIFVSLWLKYTLDMKVTVPCVLRMQERTTFWQELIMSKCLWCPILCWRTLVIIPNLLQVKKKH